MRHTADGEDLSPPLAWTAVPPGCHELALVVDDPDAPGASPWVHWLLYGISPSLTAVPEGVPPARSLSQLSGSVQGFNSWRCIGYRGPSPPPGHGTHHYRFVLQALDRALHLPPGMERSALFAAMESHVLTRAELVGTYTR